MGPRAATIARLEELEREHHRMVLANRYIRARRPEQLADLGYTKAEIRNLILAKGYPEAALINMRSAIRYFRTKSRRRLWLPDPGETP
jgi:hypothetical protein